MFFIKSIVDDKCLVKDTKDGVEEWYYCKDILNLKLPILGKENGKLRVVSNEDVLNYFISLLKLSGVDVDIIDYPADLLGLSLTSITIQGSCLRCVPSGLISFEIPYGITSVGDYCFSSYERLQSVTIPDSVTSLGRCCFSNCSSLQSITMPDSVIFLGDECFRECKNLQSITIPASVTSIGAECFGGCESLQSIIIPVSVTSIGKACFWGCRSLKLLKLPKRFKSRVKYLHNIPSKTQIEYY